MLPHHWFKHAKIAVRNRVMSALTPPVLAVVGALSASSRRRCASFGAGFLAAFRMLPYRTALANIAVALPEKSAEERRKLACASLSNMILTGLEVMHIIRHPSWVADVVTPPADELLALSRDSAVIVCIPHIGNWEILAQAYPTFVERVSAVAETLGNPAVNRRLMAARAANGLQIIPREGAARKVLRALHEKRTIGLLVDQNVSPRDGGEFANVFGLPATISPLPAVLAKKLDIPVAILAAIRNADGTFSLIHRMLPRAVADYQTAAELSDGIQKTFEEIIRAYPEQYSWLYHRWRYIPRNAQDDLVQKFPFYAVRRPYDAPQELMDKLAR